VGGGETDEASDHLGERVRQRADVGDLAIGEREATHGAGELREEVIHRRSPQRLLGGEVVVDLRLVRVDALGDGAGRGAVEALGAELDQRRVEQARAQVLAIATDPRPTLPRRKHRRTLSLLSTITSPATVGSVSV